MFGLTYRVAKCGLSGHVSQDVLNDATSTIAKRLRLRILKKNVFNGVNILSTRLVNTRGYLNGIIIIIIE